MRIRLGAAATLALVVVLALGTNGDVGRAW